MKTLDILERLVAFPTVSAESNIALIDWVEAYLRARGFQTQRLPNASGDKAGLFAQIGKGEGGVLLSGHTDVVPVEGQPWTGDPFKLRRAGDRVFGRGTTDMKGFVASVLALADRVEADDLKEPLKLVFSYDEEVGCIGIAEMLPWLTPLLGQPRACIVGEPTEMRVAIGHKGKAAFRAVCQGEAGHSALAPRFRNALHLAADFIAGLRAMQDRLAKTGARNAAYDIPYTTLHVGTMSGGTALNMVPERAELLFEFRHLAGDDPAELRAAIEAISADIGSIQIENAFAYPGLSTPLDAEITRIAQDLAHTDTCKVAYGTEAGFFDGLGIPTVVCGPGSMERDGHKPDEGIDLSQLVACDQFMDRLLATMTR
ncbi:Acetylornithine deacetylase [Candidatus Rhodobacter oscarellae]|uniref:Acetylornithine deacetylase n=1 Tax=Candidatus Rhodobacter oscarellae TaxID=1675527 RepID=A0A0J9E7U5_9RHOB|nr:acetylornithine deacetylase [Candidatus Rhodobacter lobularis]KMW58802.1 Acetylornithine deacetylase [Candidatus Rhodobacter lobularis]